MNIAFDEGTDHFDRVIDTHIKNLRKKTKYELVYMRGGTADNAIPQKAEALIQVRKKDVDKVRRFVEKQKKEISSVHYKSGDLDHKRVIVFFCFHRNNKALYNK